MRESARIVRDSVRLRRTLHILRTPVGSVTSVTIPYAGVLFDFSSTLFYIESAAEATAASGLDPDLWARRLQDGGALNGSSGPEQIPHHLRDIWSTRDLSLVNHRQAYSGLARHTGLSADEASALYDRGVSSSAWRPYPDTVSVLTELRARRTPTALVSNIGWDPRSVLTEHGVIDLFDTLVLSYEVGVVKPDHRIFQLACAGLRVDPSRTVMVGDNVDADGAAAGIGCTFVHVEPDVALRPPHALRRAVGLD